MDPKGNSGYHKSSAEKFILRGLFDVFIAPVCAAFATVMVLSLDLIALGLSSAVPFLFSYYFSHLDEKALITTSISISTICSMILASMLPKLGSFRLALPVGITTAIAGLLCMKFEVTGAVSISLFCAAGSAIGAVLYWSLLEDRSNSSISRVLTHSYASMSSLNQKPKEDDQSKKNS